MGDKVRYSDEYGNEAYGTIVGFVSTINNIIVAIIRTKAGQQQQVQRIGKDRTNDKRLVGYAFRRSF
jgi:hypothetical protein